ncbi:diguanylate cyclase [Pseudooceanicola lipolyticus]|uniref:Diguanylate cyclase n=1 Tax=Pseudooceanicola lipolyticus TaxID=2029104 RepID=A0A2M8J3P6_9RHOB|nr:diguanylate cyclase [Pseudooceanicola lipolyticus]
MVIGLFEWILLSFICFAAALGAVTLLTLGNRRKPDAPPPQPPLIEDDQTWLFDGAQLIQATPSSRHQAGAGELPDSWDSLRSALVARFPDFPDSQDQVSTSRGLRLTAKTPGDPGVLEFEWLDSLLRVRLIDDRRRKIEANLTRALRDELANLRNTVNRLPYPIWRTDDAGQVTWSNAAYNRLGREMHREGEVQAPLFPTPALMPERDSTRRVAAGRPDAGPKRWFDVTAIPDEHGRLYFATNVDAVIEAENAQRNFVQTLAKTFAQLSIGLAIFDRRRQLALFNPALVDLTALPAEFLSARPTLLTFFDRLRDQRIMPEPKNYSSWRHQMADLVAAASDGRYHETWSLPSGSVFSVSGRPHPDGAIAFLIEDITAEITLTRRFRSDLEQGQAILDRLDDAIAVFSADGHLTVTNAAYRKLWSVDPEMSFAETSVIEATRCWQKKCRASPVWGEIRDFVELRENRSDWWAQVQLKSGESLACHVHPIQSGAAMVVFSRITTDVMASAMMQPHLDQPAESRLMAGR